MHSFSLRQKVGVDALQFPVGAFCTESLQYSTNESSDHASRITDAETTPSSLTRFYEQYIALIASEKPVIASVAEKTLYWLVFATEPLPASDIACAISLGLAEAEERLVQPIDGAKLAQCCQGLSSRLSSRG